MLKTTPLLLVLLLAASAALAQPPVLKRGDDLARLDVFVGEWAGTLTRFLPGGRKLEVEPRATFAWGLGGVWLRGHDRTELENGPVIENVTELTWVPRDRVYAGFWQDNVFPGIVAFTGRWLDDRRLELDTGTFDLRGRPHRVVFTYTLASADELAIEMRQSWDGGEPMKMAEGRLVRTSPARGGDLPVDARMLGVWREADAGDGEPKTVELTESHWAVVQDGRLQHRAPVIGQRGDELVVAVFGNRVAHRVRLDGDALEVTFTPAKTKFRPDPQETTERYVRLDERLEAFDSEPLPLGDPERPVSDARREQISAELVARGERDQEVRKIFVEPGAQPTEDDTETMRRVDRDNTAYLRGLLAEVGWIDAGRFGPEAAGAAWLIVQHSGDLRLMQTVLPEIEAQVRAGAASADRFALLYDRTQLWLGRKQRFGSQVFYGPEGMFLAPLEEPEGVDARRAELGMPPLAEYLENFRERNDGRELPIRHEF